MKRIILLLVCWAIIPTPIQAAELFRWVDKAGNVHYGDVAPSEDAAEVERKKISAQPEQNSQNIDLPYETRRAQKNFPVTLYVGSGCGELCDQGRSLLSKRGIPFSEKLLQTKQDIDAFKQLTGIDNVVPTLAVGKSFLRGFLAPQWNNELDIAGYPKTASYSQRNAPLPLPTPLTTPAPAATSPAPAPPAEVVPAESAPAPAAE